jgi:predicted RNase H-related nuclease YkuK (DUF458 family)
MTIDSQVWSIMTKFVSILLVPIKFGKVCQVWLCTAHNDSIASMDKHGL